MDKHRPQARCMGYVDHLGQQGSQVRLLELYMGVRFVPLYMVVGFVPLVEVRTACRMPAVPAAGQRSDRHRPVAD